MALLARGTGFSEELAKDLPDSRAYACDVSDADSVAKTLDRIRNDLGNPETVVYNAGSGVWGDVESIDCAAFVHDLDGHNVEAVWYDYEKAR